LAPGFERFYWRPATPDSPTSTPTSRGLLRFGKPVAVVTDAIQPLSAEASAAALGEMRAGGVRLLTAAQITA